jgi:N-acetylglucosaminyldiphosphoundecaprenol N-acetyl-beta-D-mannosaminyltransferase
MRFQDVPLVHFKGVKVNNICYQNVLELVRTALHDRRPGYICLTDVSNLIVASGNDDMRRAINDSLLSLPDGMPLVWFARLAGCQEIERISGASLLEGLFRDLQGCRHYLLGDTEEIIAKVIARARVVNPDIDITGHSPPFKEFDAQDNRIMMDRIRQAQADIVWVCFGGGKQERWMKQQCAGTQALMIGVGAAFRFFTGDIITPPLIIQKLGLQWTFRLTESLIKDPLNFFPVAIKRRILSSKLIYLLNLPREVLLARRQVKVQGGGKAPR